LEVNIDASTLQIVTLRLSYKLQWPESRMAVNTTADWGEEGEINISPDNIEVFHHLVVFCFFFLVCFLPLTPVFNLEGMLCTTVESLCAI
jgi:hypothetical protein